jgi:uncharacterized protein
MGLLRCDCVFSISLSNQEVKKAPALSASVAVFAILFSACAAEQTPLPEPADRLSRSLIEATRGNRISDVRTLLAQGASPDSTEAPVHGAYDGGATALILAVKSGNIDLVSALISAGAHVNLKQGTQHDGPTPRIVAAAQGHEGIVRLLLLSGANVNARMGLDGTQPGALHWAVKDGHHGVVSLLLGEGAIVDRRDLYEALHSGRAELVTRLLAAGGDPCWRFSTGRTVMEEAERAPEATRRQVVSTVRLAMGLAPATATH